MHAANQINGRSMAMDRIDFGVREGTVEVWEVTDPNMPYMYHCHLLRHEDEGMMGQFVVLGEGERIGAVPAHHHS